MFYIPETKELIMEKIQELNKQVTNVGADNISYFYVQVLVQEYYMFDLKEELRM
jgi:hypothetical protein